MHYFNLTVIAFVAMGSAMKLAQAVDSYPFTQTPFQSTNGLDIRFNGSNANTTGLAYQADGVTLDVVPRPTSEPGSGISYTSPVPINGKYYIYEQRQAPTGELVNTGLAYQLQGAGDPGAMTQAVQVAPGVSVKAGTVDDITGNGNTAPVGINLQNAHSTDQLLGGYSNAKEDRTEALDALIQSARTSANATFDLNTGKWLGTTPVNLGSPTNFIVAYARGNKNPDGTIAEKIGFHQTQMKGYGLLVVEIDDPDKAKFEMTGQASWTGLVVVVSNKIPKSNSSRVMTVGGNTGTAIVGGAFLYFRNQKRFPGETLNLLNTTAEFGVLGGNAALKFSPDAIDQALKFRPTQMVVRSWRKLAENE